MRGVMQSNALRACSLTPAFTRWGDLLHPLLTSVGSGVTVDVGKQSTEVKMSSFTYGSKEGAEAVVNRLPQHYDMSLNRTDMEELVTVLRRSWEHGNDWAGDFLSTIAETVGVEFV